MLPEDAERFRDTSREIGLVVYYKISLFVDEAGEENIVQPETLSLSVTAFDSYYIYSPEKKSVNLSWQVENRFSDGVLIQEKSRFDSEYETVGIIEFGDQQGAKNDYQYQSDLETFTLDVRLTAFQYRGEEIIPIQQVADTLSINNPEKFEITFINELETRVDWDYSVDFADYYLFTVRFDDSGNELNYELQPDDFSSVLDMEMESGKAHYTLQAMAGEDQGAQQEVQKYFNIRIPGLNYSSTSLNAVTLRFEKYWEGPSLYSAIIVERRVNDGVFDEIAEVPPTQGQFTDTDLITTNTYSYRIRTLTQAGYDVIELSNKNRYVPVGSSQIEFTYNMYSRNIHFLSPDKVVYYRTYFSNQASTDLDIIDLDNLNNRVGFDSGSDYLQSRVSPSANKVAEFIEGNTFSEYDLNIWDLNSNTLLRTISNAHKETSLTDIIADLGFNRDGSLLVSAISNKQNTEIKIWDSGSGDLTHTIAIPGERLYNFLFNPEKDELIVQTSKGLYIYETGSFERRAELRNLFYYDDFIMKLSGNGKKLYLYRGSRIILFDVDAKEIVANNDLESSISYLSTNRDGSELLIKVQDWIGLYDSDSLNLNYILKFDYGSLRITFLSLNPKSMDSAVSFEVEEFNAPIKVVKWERRDVWYMDPIRQ